MTTKSYIVVTPLRNGGDEPIPPGEPVTLDAVEGDALVALRALLPGAAAPIEEAPPRPAREKPLGQQNKAELRATAAREGVEVRADAQNAQIVAAIEAKRDLDR